MDSDALQAAEPKTVLYSEASCELQACSYPQVCPPLGIVFGCAGGRKPRWLAQGWSWMRWPSGVVHRSMPQEVTVAGTRWRMALPSQDCQPRSDRQRRMKEVMDGWSAVQEVMSEGAGGLPPRRAQPTG